MKIIYNFQNFETIRSLTKNIFYSKINLDDADQAQINLLNDLFRF